MHAMQHMQPIPNEGSIIAGRWFCCLFNVQAGVIIFSSMGCALMLTVSLVNLGGEENTEALSDRGSYYPILYCYTLPMLKGFSLLYVGANKPDMTCLVIGLSIQFAFGVYWIIITALSFVDKPEYVYKVCIDNRCPETLWLFNTEWRTYGNDCIVRVDELLVAPPEDLGATGHRKMQHVPSTELPLLMENVTNIGDQSEKQLIPQTIAPTEIIAGETHLGGRSLYDLTNDNPDVKLNLTELVSRNHQGNLTHDNSSLEENNHTNEYENDGDSLKLENLGRYATLLTLKNQSSGTTRTARLAQSAEDIDDALEALFRLLSKKPFSKLNEVERLRALSYGSRVLGCTENIENSTAKSIIGAIIWFVFALYGNLGAFMLIIELRRMTATGELEDALKFRTRKSDMFSGKEKTNVGDFRNEARNLRVRFTLNVQRALTQQSTGDSRLNQEDWEGSNEAEDNLTLFYSYEVYAASTS